MNEVQSKRIARLKAQINEAQRIKDHESAAAARLVRMKGVAPLAPVEDFTLADEFQVAGVEAKSVASKRIQKLKEKLNKEALDKMSVASKEGL